ncbi:hypothetical protein ABPG75_004430 [Micractinium tetrahymenae]
MQRLRPPGSVMQRSQSAMRSAAAAGGTLANGSAGRRQQRQQQRRLLCSASSTAEAAQLLDQFWLARGVVEEEQRRRLVAAAGSLKQLSGSEEGYEELELPSLSAAWFLGAGGEGSPEVAAVSRRILALQQLLGGGDVDVVWMLVREPRLLSTDFRSIMQRLFDMKLAEGSEGIDVIRLVEEQPALLLAAGPEGGSEDDESADARLAAWRHGLVSDGAAEWGRRYEQLQRYHKQHGDAHAGYRDGDDAELGRWAAKQRSEAASGQLDGGRRAALEALGFEFDGERAEWLRWLTEIRTFREREGHCQPQPLAHPNDFLLINWVSVQRIMRRCNVLAPERIALLDELGFDWSGADPLS